MQLSNADVAIKYAAQLKAVQHIFNILYVLCKTLWRNGGILYQRYRFCISRHSGKQSQARLTQCPNSLYISTIYTRKFIPVIMSLKVRLNFIRPRINFFHALSCNLNAQNCSRISMHKKSVFILLNIILAQLQNTVINQLNRHHPFIIRIHYLGFTY